MKHAVNTSMCAPQPHPCGWGGSNHKQLPTKLADTSYGGGGLVSGPSTRKYASWEPIETYLGRAL
ncbi:hypothetical protein ALT721_930029 [Alteromonas alvinellae]